SDLLRARPVAPLDAQEERTAAHSKRQEGRDGGDPQSHVVPRSERNDLAANLVDSLQHLGRTIELRQGPQLALDLSRELQLGRAGGTTLQMLAQPGRLGGGQVAIQIGFEEAQRLFAERIVIEWVHDGDTSRSRSRSLRRPRWRWTRTVTS